HRADSSVVERLAYTELVGGSNPSPRTIFRLNEAETEETASNWMPVMHEAKRHSLSQPSV
ncbi:MAG: hypothetical protein JWR15_2957, partial [Prosthecobacter sp.]|nr:hypothetical protein [Prosthecobacter sp.]